MLWYIRVKRHPADSLRRKKSEISKMVKCAVKSCPSFAQIQLANVFGLPQVQSRPQPFRAALR